MQGPDTAVARQRQKMSRRRRTRTRTFIEGPEPRRWLPGKGNEDRRGKWWD